MLPLHIVEKVSCAALWLPGRECQHSYEGNVRKGKKELWLDLTKAQEEEPQLVSPIVSILFYILFEVLHSWHYYILWLFVYCFLKVLLHFLFY